MTKYWHKVIMAGNKKTGKTSAVTRLKSNKFSEEYGATIGVDFYNVTNQKDSKEAFNFNIWDVAGNNFRFLNSGYFRGADAVAIVVDINSDSMNAEINAWFAEIDNSCSYNTSVYLIGTHKDLISENEYPLKKEAFIAAAKALEWKCGNRFQCAYMTSNKDLSETEVLNLDFKTSSQVRSKATGQPEPVLSTMLEHFTESIKAKQLEVPPIPSLVSAETKKSTTPNLGEFNDWRIRVEDLRSLLVQYSKKRSYFSFWRALNYDYGSTSMKKLNELIKGKEDDAELTGKDILNCLSPHRQLMLDSHSKISSEKGSEQKERGPRSGTEHVIRAIFDHMQDNNKLLSELCRL